MKRVLTILFFLFMPLQLVLAGGYESFHEALTLFGQSKYSQAKTIFEACLLDPVFEEVKNNINTWIVKCDAGIQEQRLNAQAAEKRRQEKNAQRKENKFVYISVNGAESGEIYSSTESAMSEVMRLNGRRFCPNIDDALTLVTVTLNIKTLEPNNGFYKAVGNGVVRLGSAIDEKEFVGQWSVDCEATSVTDADDAKRLLRNKINYKLSYALDNLLNGRPQGTDYYIPEQSISLYFPKNNIIPEENLAILKESLKGYITETPGITLTTALDQEINEDRDAISKMTSQYVKMESRAPIHELEGFEQILRISIKNNDEYVVITGEISELSSGISLSTVIVDGTDFDIRYKDTISVKDQKLIAKIMAVGLGYKNWVIGEDIGGYKLVSFNGINGLLVREYSDKRTIDIPDPKRVKVNNIYPPIELIRDKLKKNEQMSDKEAKRWRIPTLDELGIMHGLRNKISLDGIYWSRTPGNKKGTHFIFDLVTGERQECKDTQKAASWLLVKEF